MRSISPIGGVRAGLPSPFVVMAGRILVGTSSWADPGFVKEWYPPKLPAKERLPWYAQRFEAVELNSSFYAIPDRNVVRGWVESTPDGFVFDVKVHRALSRHSAPLDSLPPDLRDDVEDEPARPRAAHRGARGGAGPAAGRGDGAAGRGGQARRLPRAAHARVRAREARAGGARRPGVARCARGRWRWSCGTAPGCSKNRIDATLGWFTERGVAFVCVDAPPGEHVPIMPPIDATTRDDLAYVRIHGRNTDGYMHRQDRGGALRLALRRRGAGGDRRAARARSRRAPADVHVMFNNNRDDDAPTAARRFRALLGQEPSGEEQLTWLSALGDYSSRRPSMVRLEDAT